MKIGRNDPCPCGSGKKYKKCCYENDLESERKELEDMSELEYAGLLPRQSGQEYHVHDENFNTDEWHDEDEEEVDWEQNPQNRQLWLQYTNMPFYDKIAMIKKLLSGEQAASNIPVIDLLQELAGCTHTDHEIADYFTLLASIRDEHSSFYAKYAFVILNDCIQICIDHKLSDKLEQYFLQLSVIANENPEDFSGLCVQLALLDRLPLLVKGYKIICEQLHEKQEPLSIDEELFLMSHDDYYVLDYLDKNPGAGYNDPAFQQFLSELEFPDDCEEYTSFFPEFLQNIKLSPADFYIRKDSDIIDGKFWISLRELGGCFIPWLQRTFHFGPAKAYMLNVQSVSFILNRLTGKLDPDFTWRNVSGKSRGKTPDYTYIANVLCPDVTIFEKECQNLIAGTFFDSYRLAALLESTPYWLLFLKSVGLLDDMTLERKSGELTAVFTTTLSKICENDLEEILSTETINQAWGRINENDEQE